MTETWTADTTGLLRFPSGRTIRGRGVMAPMSDGPAPEFGYYMLDAPPTGITWPHVWVPWPDFGLPSDSDVAAEAFHDALRRAATARVEVACAGGHGRTGTALSCIAVLDGVPASEAVEYVRAGYRRTAVETDAQAAFVAAFTASHTA
ncbi:protein-tyrosine phosphatase [Stackebrandtia albiflava]|uniref:Protein-tyrosine phosphatase n=1 Tax=Stackebrandtia albiflava TaxID=406432 RepID=A0A562UQB2_9ACTN|nr:protein-tyrosine phosphatase family protein [Stackebrandtia albiflava]TWJ07796.1 protein-tyrosine phosphatase [Stackebrandtia albiflava]